MSEISFTKTTTHKVVLPFYVYAAIVFLFSTILLFSSVPAFTKHYFHPHILSITHLMALGWGTMIILGASHQLIPVITERSLYSINLARTSFILAAVGIPMLAWSFYHFDMGWPAKWGGRLVVLGILAYLINMAKTVTGRKSENVHAIFVLTASFWLFFTSLYGLILLYNFTFPLLAKDSISYLPLHAHTGVVGWFLLLIMGVASRLLPMFLISKYSNHRLLWTIYFLINAALLGYLFLFMYHDFNFLVMLPALLLFCGIILFIYYCFRVYKERLRKSVDDQIKLSMLSVLLILIPVLFLFIIIVVLNFTESEHISVSIAYGFLIFFGWITAIILGMTFKTLPFIVWNKLHRKYSGMLKISTPGSLVNKNLFRLMSLSYLTGLVLFTIGILISHHIALKSGAAFLILSSTIYVWDVLRIVFYKEEEHGS